MAMSSVSLGRTLADIRKRRGLTQKSLADHTGLTVNYISLVENGERGISTDTLNSIATALQVPAEFVAFLAGDGGEMQGKELFKLVGSLKTAILETISAESESA